MKLCSKQRIIERVLCAAQSLEVQQSLRLVSFRPEYFTIQKFLTDILIEIFGGFLPNI
jgi:hypothetical protein